MSTSQAPRRRADLRPRSRRPARVVGTVLAVLLVAIAAAAAWMLWNGLQARDQLLEALPAVQRLQDQITGGDPEAAAATLADLQAATSDARDRTDGPLWAAAGALPLVGDDVSAATAAIEIADDVARRALPPAVEASGALDPAALQPKDGRIALEPIQQAAPLVRAAADEMVRAAQAASGIDVDGVDSRIAGPVTDLRDQLADVADLAATAADAVEVLPGMLGADGPRSYLLLFQNNAEVRATGGIPGSLVLITADGGQPELVAQASSSDFPRYEEPVLDLPPELAALHGDSFGRVLQDVNLTPHFPLAAQLAREMWSREFGEQVDGVLATDPVALSYLLEATGPVPLATGGELTAQNAVPLLLSEVYATYDDPRAQDAFFAAAAASIFQALTDSQGDPRALVDQLARAAGEGRVLLWPADDAEQQVLAGTVLEGAVESGDAARDDIGVYLSERPWGQFQQFVQNQLVTVKVITVEPGHRLSLQRHGHRAELWHVLDVPMDVIVDGRSWTADVGEQVLVASGCLHRLGNSGGRPGRVPGDRLRRLRRGRHRAARRRLHPLIRPGSPGSGGCSRRRSRR